jgi:hypothetical protein
VKNNETGGKSQSAAQIVGQVEEMVKIANRVEKNRD